MYYFTAFLAYSIYKLIPVECCDAFVCNRPIVMCLAIVGLARPWAVTP